jgi:hypothetical protein
MPRLYTPSLLFTCLSILILVSSIVNAHLIEVSAGKKECFFEDLHVHDKVRTFVRDAATQPHLFTNLDDCNLPGWRRWPP